MKDRWTGWVKSRTTPVVMAVLAAITAGVYSRAAFLPFAFIDDADYVTKNAHVSSGLSLDSIAWAFTAFHADNWHPLTWLSLMLDSQLFGSDPAGFHLVNVALHAANASLLFLLFRSMTGAVWRSAFVAACFALHPLHVESVAWITERKDVLSTLFLLLTLLCYSRSARQPGRSWYLLSLTAFALGLMAKPMLVTVPLILVLLDFWPLERMKAGGGATEPDGGNGWGRVKPLVLEKVPFATLAAASSLVTLYAQKSSMSSLTNVPFFTRITNAFWSVCMYVAKMVFPFDLAIMYPLVLIPLWKAGCAAAIVSGIVLLVLKHRNRYPYLAFGWFWYLITLLPVIGIVQVGRQSMADRYTYVPLIGLFVIAGWGGAELCARRPGLKNALCLTAAGLLLFFSVKTWVQLGYWRDNFDLINHTLRVTKNNHFAHYWRGTMYEVQGKTELAMAEYRKSIEIEPRIAIVHFDYGFILDKQDRTAEAIRQFEEAIAIDPRFAQAHFTLAIVLDRTGRHAEALAAFAEAVRLEPDNPKFHNNFGIALAQQGMIDEAISHFSRALQLNPQDEKAMENLQTAQWQKRQEIGR